MRTAVAGIHAFPADRMASRTFAQFKTNTARMIGEQIHHRTFNATHLQAEYAKGDPSPEKLLDEARRDELRNILLKDAPLPKLAEQGALPGLKDFAEQARRCLDDTVGTSVLRELADHPSMMNWVKTGQQYHRDHSLDECLLCGNQIPKLLREYDSEYHYLFSLVKAFAESDGTTEDYLFLMPNAMRKVADVFLAFKRPGSNGLGDKIEALAREADKLGIDGDRFRAIDRLVQVESHGDSLEDLIAFSSMTIEESHQCAVALMDIIEKLDGEHHKRLCSQCS